MKYRHNYGTGLRENLNFLEPWLAKLLDAYHSDPLNVVGKPLQWRASRLERALRAAPSDVLRLDEPGWKQFLNDNLAEFDIDVPVGLAWQAFSAAQWLAVWQKKPIAFVLAADGEEVMRQMGEVDNCKLVMCFSPYNIKYLGVPTLITHATLSRTVSNIRSFSAYTSVAIETNYALNNITCQHLEYPESAALFVLKPLHLGPRFIKL